jgi:hypothetical protein
VILISQETTDQDHRAISVPLTLDASGIRRSITGSPRPSSDRVARLITAICKQALAPYKRGVSGSNPLAPTRQHSFLEIAGRGLVLDVCPISNVRTGAVASLAEHPLAELVAAGVSRSVSTDAPGDVRDRLDCRLRGSRLARRRSARGGRRNG